MGVMTSEYCGVDNRTISFRSNYHLHNDGNGVESMLLGARPSYTDDGLDSFNPDHNSNMLLCC